MKRGSDSKREQPTKAKSKVTNMVTLAVLKSIKGSYAAQVARDLGFSERKINYHIKKLINAGYLTLEVRSSSKIYNITPVGETALKRAQLTKSSYSTTRDATEEKGVHDIYIKIPITHKGKVPATYWDKVNEKWKHSNQYHKNYKLLDAHIRETTRHICIQLRPRTLENYDQVYGLITGAIGFVIGEFTQHGYILDYLHPEVKGIHLSYGDEKSRELLRKKLRVSVGLGRTRTKFFPGDPDHPAQVWLDTTPESNWETNDYEHARLRAMEPENVARIAQLMEKQAQDMALYAQHLERHTGALEALSKTMPALRKMAVVIEKRFAQRNLKEFV